MTTAQIILLIIGIVIVIISFFVIDRNDELGSNVSFNNLSSRELSEEEVLILKNQVKSITDIEIEKNLENTKDILNKLSNDTIISIDDFSNQVLAKIEHNNEEVVFLYNMLTTKEEEFKKICSKMESAKRENKDLLDKLAELKLARARSLENKAKMVESTNQMNKSEQRNVLVKTESVSKSTLKASDIQNLKTVPQNDQDLSKDKHKESRVTGMEDSGLALDLKDMALTDEQLIEERNKEILSLHKQNKSVLDISRQLGLGQGEVKLVIDLYGHK